MKEIAFLEMPGFGINRLWWPGGRYAYVSAHFDGFTDHILCIVDLKDITKPEIVSRWWLPGMNRAGGETSTLPKGRRVALHHMITAGDRGYARVARWRIHDPRYQRSAPNPSCSRTSTGRHRFPAARTRRCRCRVAVSPSWRTKRTPNKCAKGTFHTFVVDVRAPENPVPISTLPTPKDRDFCSIGTFGPHNLHENRPGSFRSEDIIFATYNNAGVRVFDIKDAFAPKEIASWVPPVPKRLIDPRPNVALAAKTCDVYVTPDGLMYVSDWNAGMHVLQYEG